VEIYDADGKPVQTAIAGSVSLTGTIGQSAGAQAKPDFSGNWKMNPSKSDFGMMPAPSSLVRKITHSEPNLKVVNTQVGERGEFTIELAYTTDGKECANKIMNWDAKSTLKWEGSTLVVDSKLDIQGNLISMSEKWTLSEDGKTLTIAQHFAAPQGEMDAKTVLEKQ
jgi:hypothetical protein